MALFEVWAPRAREVEVVVSPGQSGERRVAMRGPDAEGWFRSDVEGLGPGDDYSFSLDGGPPRPDPRSPSQPAGVHGPSRLVDHETFPWTDAGWVPPSLADGVVYELHVGTFSPEGTFDGAAARLDHLADLGVTTVEVMPVAEFPGRRGWGYDGVDLWAPHSAYGGPDGFKRLVDACHARGLAVVLDVVYNHLGPDGNYLPGFGPYFTDRYVTPWGEAVNYDGAESDQVRAFVVGNACMWVRDYHVDGLRLDAVHAIVDTSAVSIVEEIATAVHELGRALGRPTWVVAESDLNDPRVVRAVDAGGYGCDAQWSDDFHHALHAALTGEREGYYADFGSLAHLAKALTRVWVHDGCRSAYRRRHGRPATDLPGSRFFGYLQNQDQVGNRAPRRRSSTSPTTTTPTWRELSAKGGGESSRPSAGTPPRSPTLRTPRPSGGRSSTGASAAVRPMPSCSTGTATSSGCGGRCRRFPAGPSRRSESASTRTPAGSSWSGAPSRSCATWPSASRPSRPATATRAPYPPSRS